MLEIKQLGGGRMGEPRAFGITEQLVTLGFEAGRMKTGTPPRVDGRSLDYSKWKNRKEMKILKSSAILIHQNSPNN